MSRKLILTLATAITVAAASFASDTTYARGFGGGFGGGHFGGGHFGGARFGGGHFFGHGGGTLTPILDPGRPGRHGRPGFPGFPGRPGHPPIWVWHHHHHHWVFRDGIWIDIDAVADETPAVVSDPAPGPCTCLTKTYTPNGLVVFADVCTKEAAIARVDGTAADASQAPTSDASQAPTSDATQGPTAGTTQGSSTTQGATVDLTKVPTSPNYAGRTYSDYLVANPQAVPLVSQKN